MKIRYIVKDKSGTYQSAYSCSLGEKKAYDWAVQCAKTVNGVVYLIDTNNQEKEQEVYRTVDSK